LRFAPGRIKKLFFERQDFNLPVRGTSSNPEIKPENLAGPMDWYF